MFYDTTSDQILYQAKIFPVRKINLFMLAAMGALLTLVFLGVGWYENLFNPFSWGLCLVIIALLFTTLAIVLFRKYQTHIRLVKRADGEVYLMIGHGSRVAVWKLPLEYQFSYFMCLVGKRNYQYPALLLMVMDENKNCILAVQEDLAVQYRPPEDWQPTELAVLKQLPRMAQHYRNLFSRPRLDHLKQSLDQAHRSGDRP